MGIIIALKLNDRFNVVDIFKPCTTIKVSKIIPVLDEF